MDRVETLENVLSRLYDMEEMGVGGKRVGEIIENIRDVIDSLQGEE